jgi:hypothetical protein
MRSRHQHNIMHNQVHQKSWDPELGFPSNLMKKTWLEIHWIEPAGSEGYWQAFRIAGEDLGVDITQGDIEFHLQNTALTNY